MEDVNITELDAMGLTCPLPLLKAKQALNQLSQGEKLRVLTTDPGSWRDFRAFAEQSRHQLLVCEERNDLFEFVLVKG